MKNIPEGYIRVNGNTYFEEAIRNFLSFQSLFPILVGDAQEQFIDDHIDDRNIFGLKKYRSRRACREDLHIMASEHWMCIETFLETLGYIPKKFTKFSDEMSAQRIVYGSEMLDVINMAGTEECYVSTNILRAVDFWGKDVSQDIDELWSVLKENTTEPAKAG